MERYYYIMSRFGFFRATAKSYAPKWTKETGLAYAVKSWDEAAATLANIQLVTSYPVELRVMEE